MIRACRPVITCFSGPESNNLNDLILIRFCLAREGAKVQRDGERMRSLGIVIAAGGLVMASAVSMAQGTGGYPDMRGQWKGTAEAVVVGSGPHNS